MSTFEEWKEKNSAILNRCTFDQGWRWAGSTYIDTFRVHLSDEPLTKDYDVNNHNDFISRYEVQKATGYWQGDLFNRIRNLLKEANIPTPSGMEINNGCHVYDKYCSRKEITQIKELIEKTFKLSTRLHQVEKGHYHIYMHSNKLVLKTLDLNEHPETVKKGNKPNRKFDPSTDAEDWLTDMALKMGVSREEAMERIQTLALNKKLK